MIYTITTRTRKRGIYFEPHELRPLGIGDGSCCWGLFVEGRHWYEKMNLGSRSLPVHVDQQSPHMMLSTLDPDAWPRAFTIQVLMERRTFSDTEDGLKTDALYGLTDALGRFGVNILLAQTAQVGYDLVSFIATCELVRLSESSRLLVGKADAAGQQLAEKCATLGAPTGDWQDKKNELAEAEHQAYKARATAFQELGLQIIPCLAELEARLLLLEHLRYRWDRHTQDRARILTAGRDPSFFELVVGTSWGSFGSAEERSEQFKRAVSAPWFCNSKVVEAGENSYYLSYHSVMQEVARRKKDSGTASSTTGGSGHSELDATKLLLLYKHTHTVLLQRPLNWPLDETVLESPRTKGQEAEAVRQSGTAERVQALEDSAAFEVDAVRGFFRRQALMPVRISALPSLAYARFWAWGGMKGRWAPFQFKFARNALSPLESGATGRGSMERLHSAINGIMGVDPADEDGKFAPQAGVLASINLRDQFMRLRFARESVEERDYLTVRVGYRVNATEAPTPSSQGLLNLIVRLLVERGFRVERAENRIIESAPYSATGRTVIEQGRVELVVKAVTPESYKLCRALADQGESLIAGHSSIIDVDMLHTEISKLQSSSGQMIGVDAPTLQIDRGFAPPDR